MCARVCVFVYMFVCVCVCVCVCVLERERENYFCTSSKQIFALSLSMLNLFNDILLCYTWMSSEFIFLCFVQVLAA